MGQPPRHGHGGWSQRPTRVSPPIALPRTDAAPQPRTPSPERALEVEERNVGVIRNKEIDVFLTQFPAPVIQHFTRHESLLWDPLEFGLRGAVVQMFEATVPRNMVYIVTDIQWFAIGPGPGIASPPTLLDEAAVYGQMHFQILFNGITPLELEGEYANVTGIPSPAGIGRVNGWPFLQRDVGEECPCFAVYARSNAKVTGRFTTVANQTFPITAVGTRINGFTLPMNVWSTIWERGV